MQSGNLLDDKLRRFPALPFIHVEAISELHNAAIGRTGLVESDRVYDVTAIHRAQPHLEVVFADRAMLGQQLQAQRRGTL